MHYIDPIVEYENYEPTADESQTISSLVRRIKQFCPSDSVVSFKLKKNSKTFNGIFRAVSQVKIFIENKEAESIATLMFNIEQAMNRNLEEWRRSRFDNKLNRAV